MKRYTVALAIACLTGSCGTPPAPLPGQAPADLPGTLAGPDDRRAVVGRWDIAFSVISTRPSGSDSAPNAVPVPDRWTTGTIQISDTIAGRDSSNLRMTMDLDFTPVLGRQVSCFQAGPGEIYVAREGTNVRVIFTPHAADCGFGGNGELIGDTLILGDWSESSFAGPATRGHFRMTRQGAGRGPG